MGNQRGGGVEEKFFQLLCKEKEKMKERESVDFQTECMPFICKKGEDSMYLYIQLLRA